MERIGFFTYILKCSDGTFYTGWTTRLEKRIKAHNDGKGARYTHGRLPVALLASWEFDKREDAMRFEWQIKQMSRQEKELLIENNELK
jgi:putative endonuclease